MRSWKVREKIIQWQSNSLTLCGSRELLKIKSSPLAFSNEKRNGQEGKQSLT